MSVELVVAYLAGFCLLVVLTTWLAWETVQVLEHSERKRQARQEQAS